MFYIILYVSISIQILHFINYTVRRRASTYRPGTSAIRIDASPRKG